MNRLSTALALTLTATLSACGGGGSSSGTPAAPPAPAPAPAAAVVDLLPTVGDFYSYTRTDTLLVDQPGATTETQTWFYTGAISQVGGDGAWAERVLGEEPDRQFADLSYSPDGGLKTTDSGPCRLSYTPVLYESQKNLAPGTTWSSDVVQVAAGGCVVLTAGKLSATASALETITVRAGTFNTVKVVSTRTASYSNGYTSADETTEWRDVVTHRVIKYSNRSNQVSNTGLKAALTSTAELAGFASARQARSNFNIERFAGPWAGSYSGTYSGNCVGQVSRDGKLDADCGDGAFSVHGDIDASGKGNFYLTVNGVRGASFSGAFASPYTINGAWTAGAASGTWVLNHK